MDIAKSMIKAMKLRKDDEFGLGKENFIYEGLDISKIRSKIGYRSKDLAKDVKKEEKNVLGIKVYKYYIQEKIDKIVISLHGGGFYGGASVIMENCNKYIAKSGFCVYAIDYTLAPEKKFPDTMYEIYDVVKEIIKINPKCKIAIIGDSAGGHLAMNVALLEPKLFSYIALFYPVICLKQRKAWNIKEYGLEEDSIYAKASINFLYHIMKLIQKLYLKKDYDEESKFFDLRKISIEDFKKFAKVKVIMAEFDYFNLDIEDFCLKFNISERIYKGMGHGFLEFLGYVPEAKQALDEIIEELKEI